jgi:hypothetical protein
MIYVDSPTPQYMGHASAQTRRHGDVWCHLWCDYGEEEALHKLAARIGLKREWYQRNSTRDHYDCIPRKGELAVEAGAMRREFRDGIKYNMPQREYDKARG